MNHIGILFLCCGQVQDAHSAAGAAPGRPQCTAWSSTSRASAAEAREVRSSASRYTHYEVEDLEVQGFPWLHACAGIENNCVLRWALWRRQRQTTRADAPLTRLFWFYEMHRAVACVAEDRYVVHADVHFRATNGISHAAPLS
jgi:hypothetical protein